MWLRAALVEAGAVPPLAAMVTWGAVQDVPRRIAAAGALQALAAGGPACRKAVATEGVIAALVGLLQASDVASSGPSDPKPGF